MISKETYKEVWSAMDACNSSGVIHSLDKWIDAIWAEAKELGKGTDYVNSHPIIVIVVDKLLQLAQIGKARENKREFVTFDTVLSGAYNFVCTKVNEGE
jgi:hypothetical protein